MQSLSKKEDIDSTLSLFEQRTQNVTIPKEKTPWYILSPEFKTGFRHWIQLSNGNKIPVPCKGGNDGKGFAPDVCPFCKKSLEYYQKAKMLLQRGREKQSEKLKEAGNSIRSTFSALFHAVRGVKVLEMQTTKTGKKKVLVPYFEDIDEDDENSVEVGILSLSQAQFENFTGMIGSEEYPFIKSGDDLTNRVIWTQKKKTSKKKRFPEVVFSAAKHTSEKPDVVIPEEQQNLEDQFNITDEEFENIWKDFAGDIGEELEKRDKKRSKKKPPVEEVDEDDDDDDEEADEEEVEVEDDDDYEEEDEDDDDYEEADEDDTDDLPDDAYLDDDEDDFEDDDPDDLPPPPKKTKAKTGGKKGGKGSAKL
jgi:hypothetical protein